MKNKKNKGKWKKNYWKEYIIIILIGIIVLSFLLKEDKFNPEKHVCEEWEYNCECIKKDTYYYDECIENNNCLKFRNKNFCERCVDDWIDKCDEECICEKYEKYKELICREKFDCEYIIKKGKCLSARKKNECEKGEEGWIEEEIKYSDTEMKCHYDNGMCINQDKDEKGNLEECKKCVKKEIEKNKICRQKTTFEKYKERNPNCIHYGYTTSKYFVCITE